MYLSSIHFHYRINFTPSLAFIQKFNFHIYNALTTENMIFLIFLNGAMNANILIFILFCIITALTYLIKLPPFFYIGLWIMRKFKVAALQRIKLKKKFFEVKARSNIKTQNEHRSLFI